MSDEVRHKVRFMKKNELTRRENVRKANIERCKQSRDKIVDKNRAETSAIATAHPTENRIINKNLLSLYK